MANKRTEYLLNRLAQNRFEREYNNLILGADLNTDIFDSSKTQANDYNLDTEVETPMNLNTDSGISSTETNNTKSFSDTLHELNYNVANGVFDFFEGIGDTLVGVAGTIGSWFGADDSWATDFIKKDWSMDASAGLDRVSRYLDPINLIETSINGNWEEEYGNALWEQTAEEYQQQLYDNSYVGLLGDDFHQKYNEFSQTIGNQLPTIILGIATMGASTSATGATQALGLGSKLLTGGKTATQIAKAVSVGAMSLSASGQGVEQVLNEDENNTLGEGLLYGILSGLVEGATEYIIPGSAVNGVVGRVSSGSVIRDLARAFVEEGTEEVISEAVSPFLELTYKNNESAEAVGKHLQESYNLSTLIPNLTESFVMGGLSALVLGGGDIIADRVKLGKNGYAYKSNLGYVIDEKNNLSELQYKYDNATTQKSKERYAKRIASSEKRLERFTNSLVNSAEKLKGNTTEQKKLLQYFTDVSTLKTADDFNKALDNITNNSLEKQDYIQTKVKEYTTNYFNAFGKMPTVDFVDNLDVNARYNENTGHIEIKSSLKNNFEPYLKHELTHSLFNTVGQESLDSLYNDFTNRGLLSEDIQRQAQNSVQKYIENKTNLSQEQIDNLYKQEVLAYYVENETIRNSDVNLIRNIFNKENLKRAMFDREFNKELKSIAKKTNVFSKTFLNSKDYFSRGEINRILETSTANQIANGEAVYNYSVDDMDNYGVNENIDADIDAEVDDFIGKYRENLINNATKENIDALINGTEDVFKQTYGTDIDSLSEKSKGKFKQLFDEIRAKVGIDNSINKGENINDDFRRLHEQSRKLLKKFERGRTTYQDLDSSIRERYTRSIQQELGSGRNSTSYNFRTLKSSKGGEFKITNNVSPTLFHDAFETIKPYIKQNELVDLHDNYEGTKCFLSDDGLQGFAIEKNGNLISVFNADVNKRGFVEAISDYVKENGATHLDCYGYLAKYYNKVLGFKVASLMEYNMEYDHHNIAKSFNNPEVAFMVNTDENVKLEHFNKDQYDEAQQYQLSFVENSNILQETDNKIELKLLDENSSLQDFDKYATDFRSYVENLDLKNLTSDEINYIQNAIYDLTDYIKSDGKLSKLYNETENKYKDLIKRKDFSKEELKKYVDEIQKANKDFAVPLANISSALDVILQDARSDNNTNPFNAKGLTEAIKNFNETYRGTEKAIDNGKKITYKRGLNGIANELNEKRRILLAEEKTKEISLPKETNNKVGKKVVFDEVNNYSVAKISKEQFRASVLTSNASNLQFRMTENYLGYAGLEYRTLTKGDTRVGDISYIPYYGKAKIGNNNIIITNFAFTNEANFIDALKSFADNHLSDGGSGVAIRISVGVENDPTLTKLKQAKFKIIEQTQTNTNGFSATLIYDPYNAIKSKPSIMSKDEMLSFKGLNLINDYGKQIFDRRIELGERLQIDDVLLKNKVSVSFENLLQDYNNKLAILYEIENNQNLTAEQKQAEIKKLSDDINRLKTLKKYHEQKYQNLIKKLHNDFAYEMKKSKAKLARLEKKIALKDEIIAQKTKEAKTAGKEIKKKLIEEGKTQKSKIVEEGKEVVKKAKENVKNQRAIDRTRNEIFRSMHGEGYSSAPTFNYTKMEGETNKLTGKYVAQLIRDNELAKLTDKPVSITSLIEENNTNLLEAIKTFEKINPTADANKLLDVALSEEEVGKEYRFSLDYDGIFSSDEVKNADRRVQGNDYDSKKKNPSFKELIETSKIETGKYQVSKAVKEAVTEYENYIKFQIKFVNDAYEFEKELKKLGISEEDAGALSWRFRTIPKVVQNMAENGVSYEADGKIIKSKSIQDIENFIDQIYNEQTDKRLSKKARKLVKDEIRKYADLYLYNNYQIDNNNLLKTEFDNVITQFFDSKEFQAVKKRYNFNPSFDKVKTFKNVFDYIKNNKNSTKNGLLNALQMDIMNINSTINNNPKASEKEKASAVKLFDKLVKDIRENVNVKTVFGKIIDNSMIEKISIPTLEKAMPNLKQSLLDLSEQNGHYVWEDTFNDVVNNYLSKMSESEKEAVKTDLDKFRSLFREFTNEELVKSNEWIVKKYGKGIEERAEAVRNYLDTLQEYRVRNNLITEEERNIMEKTYPHYVPTPREQALGGNDFGYYSSNVNATKAIMSRKGSSLLIRPLETSMLNSTRKAVTLAYTNYLGNYLYNNVSQENYKNSESIVLEPEGRTITAIRSIEELENADLFQPEAVKDGNTITFYTQKAVTDENGNVVKDKDGNITYEREEHKISFSDYAYQPIKNILKETMLDDIPGLRTISKFSSLFRQLVTTANPFFITRNAVRDISDALFTTKNGTVEFLKEYSKSYLELVRNDPNDLLLQLFTNYGGKGSTMFDSVKPIQSIAEIVERNNRSKTRKLLDIPSKVEYLNELVELAPRYTEFKLSYQKYVKEGRENALILALRDSADITTDFTRHGTVAQAINRTLVPFLNAQIQGASKLTRFIMKPRDSKEWAKLIAKMLVLGLGIEGLFELFNRLIAGDDWDAIPEYTKNQYMLIPVSNGNYIKIPRGRIIGTVQIFFRQFGRVLTGEASFEDGVKDFFDTASTNLAPVDLGSGIRTIFSPITDVRTNMTWYGQAIDSQSDLNKYPWMRYDSDTSEVAKIIGKAFNYSPNRIQYLIEQYSGVVGDILIPATTKSTYADPSNLLDFVKDNTTISAVKNFAYRGEAYELLNNLLFDKNAGDNKATIFYNYLNREIDSIGELEDLVDSTTGAEQYVAYLTMREAYKEALENVDLLGSKLDNIGTIDPTDKWAMTEAYRQVFGSEYALSYYNSQTKTKADICNELGIDYDTFYDVYFTIRGLSTKQEAVRYINSVRGLSYYDKLALQYYCGISLTNADKTKIERYLKAKGLINEEEDN